MPTRVYTYRDLNIKHSLLLTRNVISWICFDPYWASSHVSVSDPWIGSSTDLDWTSLYIKGRLG